MFDNYEVKLKKLKEVRLQISDKSQQKNELSKKLYGLHTQIEYIRYSGEPEDPKPLRQRYEELSNERSRLSNEIIGLNETFQELREAVLTSAAKKEDKVIAALTEQYETLKEEQDDLWRKTQVDEDDETAKINLQAIRQKAANVKADLDAHTRRYRNIEHGSLLTVESTI